MADDEHHLPNIIRSWKLVSALLVSTVATVAVIYKAVIWFQPAEAARAEHEQIRGEIEIHAQALAEDHGRLMLEAELERVETLIRLYNDRAERRALTRDEQEELSYLRERRQQIRRRLYGD